MTAGGAGIAAATVPGHTVDAQAQTAPSSPGDGTGNGSENRSGGGLDPGSGGFTPPQAPAGGSGPLFISGGS